MKKRIVVIDNDMEFLEEISSFFNSTNDYEIVGNSTDGTDGLQLIKQLKPDLLILELILPNNDGFFVLGNIDSKEEMKIIAASMFSNENSISKATKLGADCFMLKPFSLYNLKTRMDEMFSQNSAKHILYSKNSVEEKISNIFISLGIPAHINGFHFLREAVKIAMGNFNMVCGITKELYPQVAARFDTNPYKVERGIRHAIEIAWNKGKITNINSIFGMSVFDANEKPTNGELIALLADKMLYESVQL